jgi:hypothetical protein
LVHRSLDFPNRDASGGPGPRFACARIPTNRQVTGLASRDDYGTDSVNRQLPLVQAPVAHGPPWQRRRAGGIHRSPCAGRDWRGGDAADATASIQAPGAQVRRTLPGQTGSVG